MQTLDARRPMPQRRQGRSFTILGDAQLIHAGQHVAQLHDEGGIDAYAGIRITTLAVVPGHGIGQHAVPIIPGEVFAQQRARAAWIPRPHMSHMDGAHRTQQRILLGAVQQPRQRLARPRTHDGDQPERDGRQRRDRSRLGGRPQLANHLIAYHIGDLTPGYRHYRSGFAEPSQPGHQASRASVLLPTQGAPTPAAPCRIPLQAVLQPPSWHLHSRRRPRRPSDSSSIICQQSKTEPYVPFFISVLFWTNCVIARQLLPAASTPQRSPSRVVRGNTSE